MILPAAHSFDHGTCRSHFLLFRGEEGADASYLCKFLSLTFKNLIYSPLYPFNKTGLRISPSGLSLQIYIFKFQLASNVKQSGLSCLQSRSLDCWWREVIGRLSGGTASLCSAAPDKALWLFSS